MPTPSDLDSLSAADLKELVIQLLGEVTALKQTVAAQREEIVRLKGLKGPPAIKPSGMERATAPSGTKLTRDKPRRGKVSPRVGVEDCVLRVTAPAGSLFKGDETDLVQDAILSVRAIRYRRERWVTPEGQTIIAPLPEGIVGHFGPSLRRFVLMLYHQGQSTLPRVIALLRSIGLAISERQVQRLLIEGHDAFLEESRDVLRAGLECASWISADDTGARHKIANAYCTQIGNDRFTWLATRASKSRLNFLELPRAGHPGYALNQVAFDHMRERGLSVAMIDRLVAAEATSFADRDAWQAHLQRLGIAAPEPIACTRSSTERVEMPWI
jgi:Transposase IS66 family